MKSKDVLNPRAENSSRPSGIATIAVILALVLGSSIAYLILTANPRSSIESNWVTEIVDSSQRSEHSTDVTMGRWLSMDLDGHGYAHISYAYLEDGSKSSLRYATNVGGLWRIEIADDEIQAGSWNWIELESEERPNILYQSGIDLRLAVKSDNWSFEVIDVGRPTYPTLTFDGIGKTAQPIVAYYGGEDYSTVRVAERNGTAWRIDNLGLVGVSPSMALGHGGDVHLTYLTSEELVHAVRTDSVWSFETITSTRTTTASGSISVGVNGTVHLAFDNEHILQYAIKEEGAWNIETVDDGLDSDYRTISLDLQSNGLPAICYLKAGKVTFAWKTNEGWQKESIGEGSDDLFMALDSSNTPHVTFSLSKGKGETSLMYAYRKAPLFEGTRGSSLDMLESYTLLPGVNEVQVSYGLVNGRHEGDRFRSDFGSLGFGLRALYQRS